MSVQDALTFDPQLPGAVPRGAAEVVPEPDWWDAAKANWRLAQDDTSDYQALYQVEAYKQLEDALVATGRPRARYRNPEWNTFLHPDGWDQRKVQLWADVTAARLANPKAFADLPATQAEFERNAARRNGERDRDMKVAGAGGFGTMLAPSLAFGVLRMPEPENLLQLPMGGGARTTAGIVLNQFAAGAAGTVLTTPERVIARQRMGEGYTGDELALDALIGGAANAGFAAGHVATVKGGKLAYDQLPLDYRLARALDQAVPAGTRPPDVAAALHVVQRAAEVDATNPYADRYDALELHGQRLAEAMAALEDLPQPKVPVRAPIAERPERRETAPRGPGSLDPQVVNFFRGKGYSESQARGIAAGIHAESGSDHGARNPTSGALGLGQWLGPRKRALIARYGPNPSKAQQLEFLHHELQGGDKGGAAVLAAGDEAGVLDAYIRKFMRPAAGAETTGDLKRGMAALGRTGEIPAEPFAGMDPAPIETAPIVRPAALDTVRPVVTSGGRALSIGSFRPEEIGVDAELMQFKSGGDEFGVTERLQGVREWDPMAAGMVTVWEANDGRRLIADGHQRLGLARRIQAAGGGQDIRMNAFVLREADGFTARDARVLTALKNIGEGTGSATDAAKVFREVGLDSAAVESRLPPRSALVRDGKSLARLSPDAFGAAVNEVIPESYAAAIGALVPDPGQHMAMVDLLHKLDPPNRRQAEAIIRQALDAGFHAETQEELFGSAELVTALFAQKAKALDKTLAELRKMKGAFQVAVRNADTLESAGNTIAVDASAAAAEGNARALALVERLALRKGNAVNDLFNAAAERLASGEPIAGVTRQLVRDLGQLDLAAIARGANDDGAVRGAGDPGDGSGGSGRDGFADDEAGAAPGPASLDELEAAGQAGFALFDEPSAARFDDPAGEGVQAASESLWHDIRAELDMDPAAIETRFQEQLSDFDRARAEYEAIDDPKGVGSTDGGRIINTDLARELSPDYRADRSRSAAVHEPASAFVKELYARKLTEDPPAGTERTVLFTGGGTGAGKSTGLALLGKEADDAGIIYDTNMNTTPSAIAKIDQALAAGWDVHVVYTWRDPIEALAMGALPRAERMGRTVPVDTHIETHIGARRAIEELAAHYAGDPRVAITAIDNSRGKGNAATVTLDKLPEINHVGLHERAVETVGAAYQAGSIGRQTLRGTLGDREAGLWEAASREGRGPDAADRGQPQQQRGGPQPLDAPAGALIDLDDGKGARPIADIEAELNAGEQGIAAMRDCLK